MNKETAERVVKYLKERLNLTNVEVVLEDASSFPFFIEGCCYFDTEKNKATITVNLSLKYQQVIDIIIHEMRHVYQFSLGRFKVLGHGIYSWDGIQYTFNDYKVCQHPHEADANLYTKQNRIDILCQL